MKCERAVQEIFPVARAIIAKKLMDAYGFSQTEAAKKMGISQPAISQYKKNIRGKAGKSLAGDQNFIEIADDIAKRIADGSLTTDHIESEMCRFCRLLEPKGVG